MHLVTTAIEATWPKNKNTDILFLGEWCKLYSRKSYWEKFNSSILPYHWDDRKKLKKDYDYLDNVYENLLPVISQKLNEIHGVSHSNRYWRIFVGPWLLYFIQILFDRWYMLRSVSNVDSVIVIDQNIASMIPNDMAEFVDFILGDEWNEQIYSLIIKSEKIIPNIYSVSVPKKKQKETIKTQGFKQWLIRAINSVNKIVSRNRSYFFISDYIPISYLIRIQLALGQIPTFWRPISTLEVIPNLHQRKWHLIEENDDMFLNLLNQLIPLQIPKIYLEGYNELRSIIKTSPWPTNPKIIFTANSYSSDDYFKAWAAEKTEGTTKLIIGQHGGHFGMTPIETYAKHQYLIADKWISWGWKSNEFPVIKAVGNLKIIKKSTVKFNPLGDALIIEAEYPRYSYQLYSVPISSQQIKYLENQFLFLNLLPSKIFKKILLKPYHANFKWFSRERFRDNFPNLRIDDSGRSIKKLLSNARICVVTYNATTFLESFSWDMPTIIFWDPLFCELNDEAQVFFEMLVRVKIFHKTPDSAASHLTEVWDDVPSWWNDPVTQSAVNNFSQRWNRLGEGVFKSLVKEIK